MFTKRITIKVANLPNDAKIEYLVNKLMNELVAQGHNIKSVNGESDYFTVFSFDHSKVGISSNGSCDLRFKRLTKI